MVGDVMRTFDTGDCTPLLKNMELHSPAIRRHLSGRPLRRAAFLAKKEAVQEALSHGRPANVPAPGFSLPWTSRKPFARGEGRATRESMGDLANEV